MRWNEDMKKRQRWRVRWREKADESGITEVTEQRRMLERQREEEGTCQGWRD